MRPPGIPGPLSSCLAHNQILPQQWPGPLGGASNGMGHAETNETPLARCSNFTSTHWLIWPGLSNGDFLHRLHRIMSGINFLSFSPNFYCLWYKTYRIYCIHISVLKSQTFPAEMKKLMVWWSTLSCYVFSMITDHLPWGSQSPPPDMQHGQHGTRETLLLWWSCSFLKYNCWLTAC